MGEKNRTNVLLVEILIAVLFFMLSATVLVRVFSSSRLLTVRSGVETHALSEAQNIAERLLVAEDPEAKLKELGFVSSHGAWTMDCGEYTLYVTSETVPADAGELWQGQVSAFLKQRDPDAARQEDVELFTLPCARYKGVQS
ncbi:MAG: hypothetical protein IKS52_06905 [Clostridia bacterium]|nr:hypothetical protein [Clostridia bacterium]